MRILFVCTGNTCRSPMAAFLMRDKVKEKGLNWHVESAGIYAAPGVPMSAGAVDALKSLGVEGGGHQSQFIHKALLQEADYVFTMTYGHKRELVSRFPDLAVKIHQLGSFIAQETGQGNQDGAEYDIVDPFGGSTGEYLGCAFQLNELIEQLIAKLIQDDDGKD